MTNNGMPIHPIRTEEDHAAAIARIGELMGAAQDTPAGEELVILATLVDAYESKHHVIDAPDPPAAVRFRIRWVSSLINEISTCRVCKKGYALLIGRG